MCVYVCVCMCVCVMEKATGLTGMSEEPDNMFHSLLNKEVCCVLCGVCACVFECAMERLLRAWQACLESWSVCSIHSWITRCVLFFVLCGVCACVLVCAQIPGIWQRVSYLSLKPLVHWTKGIYVWMCTYIHVYMHTYIHTYIWYTDPRHLAKGLILVPQASRSLDKRLHA